MGKIAELGVTCEGNGRITGHRVGKLVELRVARGGIKGRRGGIKGRRARINST